MTASNFPQSLALTLGYEGLWSDDPVDPGKGTMCGVTQAVYDVERARWSLPLQSVRLSTPAEREAIYRTRYWNRVAGDQLPAGVDYATFDFAVNSGVGRSVGALQRVVGATEDGQLGLQTLAAVDRYCTKYGAAALTDGICHARMQFLQSLETFEHFGQGWTIRVMGHHDGTQWDDTGVIDRAYDMARGASPSMPTSQVVTPKTWAKAA